jgi:streptogrisin C
MELTKFLAALAAFLPIVYGAPTTAANSLHPEILAAMKRDLGLDAEQAHVRVARELKATEIIEQLSNVAGNSFGGAWLVDGDLNVAITDAALTAEVTAAGAKALVVDTPLSKLQEAQKALDRIDIDQALGKRAEDAASGIAVYYVDVAANKLIIEALSDSTAQAAELAKKVGLTESEYEVRTVTEQPTTFATVRGGDAYLINSSSRCSVGFSVTTGFVSAGHCGTAGRTATTTGGATLGTFSGSSFPGNDYSYIRGSSGNTFQGRINNYSGGTIAVAGSTASATGASICRSGSTTGVHCGTVRSLGATVNYSQGRVTGLTQTNVCAEPGDSGGSFYSGSQAQGVTSGGSGDCSSGGTTYFQPVNEILSAYGLTLVRG